MRLMRCGTPWSTAQVQMHVARHVLSYGHVLFIASIITVAAAMHAAIAHPGESLELGIVGLLFGGCAVYLGAFSYTRWMMFREALATRLVAAGLVVLLIPVGALVSALAALVLLAAVLVGLNVVEYQVAAASPGRRSRPAADQADGLDVGRRSMEWVLVVLVVIRASSS